MSHSTRDGLKRSRGTERLTESEYHELLAAEQRRIALDVLENSLAPVGVEDLAATVAARESDGVGVDEESVARVAIRLHHIHLPKMDDLGVIGYDPDAARVDSSP